MAKTRVELPRDKIAEFCRQHHIRKLAFSVRSCGRISGQAAILMFLWNSSQDMRRDWPSLPWRESFPNCWVRKWT